MDLARWMDLQPERVRQAACPVMAGLNAVRLSWLPHASIIRQLAADVARLESACLDNRKSCA